MSAIVLFAPASPADSISTCASPREVRVARDAKKLEERVNSKKGRRPNSLGAMLGSKSYADASSCKRGAKKAKAAASTPKIFNLLIRDEAGNVYELPVMQMA